MRNIEIKVKLENDREVKKLLKQIGTRFEGRFVQKDRYYNCPTGRLKLRETDGKFFTLVFYGRPDIAGSKSSEYWTVDLKDCQALAMRMVLGHAFGEMIVVKKKRQLWMYDNTRIHIDRVDGLTGIFLELETAAGEIGRKVAKQEHARIVKLLGLGFYISLSGSYADMLLETETNEGKLPRPGHTDEGNEQSLAGDTLTRTIFAGQVDGERIMDAYTYAANAHEGQFRKGTQIPYIRHPFRVAKILLSLPCSVEVVIAGLLHDTVEDTRVTVEEIRDTFGEKVAAIVEGVSEPDKSAPWENRKEHTIEHLRTAPMDMVVLACADKLDNLMEMHRTHQEIGEELWKRFRRPRDNQEWYYRSLADVFKDRIVELAFKRLLCAYLNTVHNLFDEPTTV